MKINITNINLDPTTGGGGNSGGGSVEIAIQERKNVEITRNKTVQIIYPDDPYKAIESLQVSVDVPTSTPSDGKMRIPNGITLQESTFTSFDMSTHDWSAVYDWHNMFGSCIYLTKIHNWPDNVEIYDAKWMFLSTKITTAPALDTSKTTDMGSMFLNCQELTSVEIEIGSCVNFKEMFLECTSLNSIKFKGSASGATADTTQKMFQRIPSTGTCYYPAEHAESYTYLLSILPSGWQKISY